MNERSPWQTPFDINMFLYETSQFLKKVNCELGKSTNIKKFTHRAAKQAEAEIKYYAIGKTLKEKIEQSTSK